MPDKLPYVSYRRIVLLHSHFQVPIIVQSQCNLAVFALHLAVDGVRTVFSIKVAVKSASARDGCSQANRQSCDAYMRRRWCSFIASLMKSIAPWIATWNQSMSNAPVLPRMSSTQ